jgi:hypothetical protein
MQKCAPALEHIGHEGAQGLHAHQDQTEEQGDLQNSDTSHDFPLRRLELLGTKQRIKQVNEETERGDAGDDVIHVSSLLELVAGLGKCPAAK